MMSDLSEDLIEEILSRVPATSLKRLRSTCKRWNILFKDHRFIKKHSDKAPNVFSIVFVVIIDVDDDEGRNYLANVNLSGIHKNINPTIQVMWRNVSDYLEIFYSNGLLLFLTETKECVDTLVVYNPCTEQTRSIELTSVCEALDKFALGYKKNKSCCFNSYKVLRFPSNRDNIPVFEIYDFNSNSWRVLDDVTRDWGIPTYDRGVSLKGNTYWVASDSEEPSHLEDAFLLKFDFTKERFQRLGLPFKSHCHRDTVVLSMVREEQLAVLLQKRYQRTMEVWLTNNMIAHDHEPKDVLWCMFFRVDLDNEYMFPRSMSFVVDEENKVAVCCDTSFAGQDNDATTRIHIVGEDEFREVDYVRDFEFDERSTLDLPFLFSYTPSLVQI